jgi:hypothetical protein
VGKKPTMPKLRGSMARTRYLLWQAAKALPCTHCRDTVVSTVTLSYQSAPLAIEMLRRWIMLLSHREGYVCFRVACQTRLNIGWQVKCRT